MFVHMKPLKRVHVFIYLFFYLSRSGEYFVMVGEKQNPGQSHDLLLEDLPTRERKKQHCGGVVNAIDRGFTQ